jgi:regulator of replication initiation timing
MSLTTIGVPTASTVAAAAAANHNQTLLEMLLRLQKRIDEFKGKVSEMEEEMEAVKLENRLLKNKISELTSETSPARSRGLFGYVF